MVAVPARFNPPISSNICNIKVDSNNNNNNNNFQYNKLNVYVKIIIK